MNPPNERLSFCRVIAFCLASAFLLETPDRCHCFAGECPEPGGTTLEACGLIVGVGPFSCPGFRTDDGTIYRIPDNGPFKTGDRVFVRGTISTFAATCLATDQILALLSCNTIERCFAECGTLTDAGSPGCLRFVASDGEEFALKNPGPFGSGETVYVTGFLGETPTQCGPDLLPTLDNDSINACVSEFGRFMTVNGCTFFQATNGSRFDLEVTAGFEEGDFAFVQGSVREGCAGPCGFPCLEKNAIDDAFGGTGVISETTACGIVLEAEITGQRKNRFVLDELGGFEPGDRVFVTGKFLRDDCPCTETDLLRRDGCIEVDSISPIFADCGRVQMTQGGCAQFVPDSGGGPFFVEHLPENFANSITGKTYVIGALDMESPFCGTGPIQTIRHNRADPCIEGCGVFGQGISCNPLLGSSSELQRGVIGAGILWVENRLGLPHVDAANPAFVFLKGGFSAETSVVVCGFPSLHGNTLSPCDQGNVDMDGNGIVTLNDLAVFVDALLLVQLAPASPDVFIRANMNGDFRLNGEDIQLFLDAFLDNFE
ncbi:MAG: hypothetical protein MI923_25530 [Phycisphaerales bacterium]|nr:hypothetical protein [Phycisphaerales bacterium]